MANIAFVSTAHIHTKPFIEQALKAADGRKIFGVWDDIPDRGKRYAELAKSRFFANLDELLANKEVDGFVICAENTQHLPLLKKLLPVEKPIFCEKPLVTSTADLKEVRNLLAKHPVPVFCGYMNPFSENMTGIASLLKSQALGKITRIRMVNAHHAAYGRWFDSPDLQWFTNPELSGGGAFMDMGTHAVHLVRTLFGPVKEVWADMGNHSANYTAVDDWGMAQLRFVSGVVGSLTAAWTQTGGIGGLEILGEKAAIWNTADGYVVGGPGLETKPLKNGPKYPDRMDRLVAAIRKEIPEDGLKVDLEVTLDAVAIMEAAYCSAKSGKWEKV